MSSNIKARGWSTQTMDFVFGDLITSGNLMFIFPDPYGFHELTSKILLVDPETVGRYSGLLDKNGKEVYEGDIIRRSGVIKKIFTVCFQNYGFEVEFRGDKHSSIPERYPLYKALQMWRDARIDFEVIGNIHEHSELLK